MSSSRLQCCLDAVASASLADAAGAVCFIDPRMVLEPERLQVSWHGVACCTFT
jgi:hypothetical protein